MHTKCPHFSKLPQPLGVTLMIVTQISDLVPLLLTWSSQLSEGTSEQSAVPRLPFIHSALSLRCCSALLQGHWSSLRTTRNRVWGKPGAVETGPAAPASASPPLLSWAEACLRLSSFGMSFQPTPIFLLMANLPQSISLKLNLRPKKIVHTLHKHRKGT